MATKTVAAALGALGGAIVGGGVGAFIGGKRKRMMGAGIGGVGGAVGGGVVGYFVGTDDSASSTDVNKKKGTTQTVSTQDPGQIGGGGSAGPTYVPAGQSASGSGSTDPQPDPGQAQQDPWSPFDVMSGAAMRRPAVRLVRNVRDQPYR